MEYFSCYPSRASSFPVSALKKITCSSRPMSPAPSVQAEGCWEKASRNPYLLEQRLGPSSGCPPTSASLPGWSKRCSSFCSQREEGLPLLFSKQKCGSSYCFRKCGVRAPIHVYIFPLITGWKKCEAASQRASLRGADLASSEGLPTCL